MAPATSIGLCTMSGEIGGNSSYSSCEKREKEEKREEYLRMYRDHAPENSKHKTYHGAWYSICAILINLESYVRIRYSRLIQVLCLSEVMSYVSANEIQD